MDDGYSGSDDNFGSSEHEWISDECECGVRGAERECGGDYREGGQGALVTSHRILESRLLTKILRFAPGERPETEIEILSEAIFKFVEKDLSLL